MENQWAKVTNEEKEIHDRLDAMIDVKKALIPQIRKMTNKEFLAFVRRPRHMDSTDGIILHADKEKDDNHKWQKDYPRNCKVILPLILMYLAVAFHLSASLHDFCKSFAVFFTCGLMVVWTYTEYYHHRFVLHRESELDPEAEAIPDLLESVFSKHIHHHVFMN